jgi:zinc/manganese transport system ATP-binding protein
MGRGHLGDGVMSAALEFRNLTLGYDRHPAVHHLHGPVKTGRVDGRGRPERRRQVDAVQGHRRDAQAARGGIDLCGLRARDIAYLPQIADIDRSFPISVYDMVAMGLWRDAGLFGGIGKREREKVRAAMSAVGLSGFEERPIGTLSGGQMQRALFARLLLQDARVIVLDEPFNAIDAKTASDLCELVMRWHAEKRTVIAALHDLDLVKSMFPEALLLAREPVAWGATKDVLTAENLLKARRMCEACDDSAHECAA